MKLLVLAFLLITTASAFAAVPTDLQCSVFYENKSSIEIWATKRDDSYYVKGTLVNEGKRTRVAPLFMKGIVEDNVLIIAGEDFTLDVDMKSVRKEERDVVTMEDFGATMETKKVKVYDAKLFTHDDETDLECIDKG